MKTKISIVIAMLIVPLFFLPAVVAIAEEIRISSIDDSYTGKEVTVSGVVTAISSNIEPSTSTDKGIQTYEPGDTGVLTLDDETDTIFAVCDPRLLKRIQEGQRVIVTGIYAGKDGIKEGKGIIYADKVSVYINPGYKTVPVNALLDFPAYYYADSVCIKGSVVRIVLTAGETELTVDDGSGAMAVEYRAEREDIKIGDEVTVEGKFYRNMIYAFTVTVTVPRLEETLDPSPAPAVTPTPAPTPTPTAASAPTSAPSPAPPEKAGFPLYIIVIIIAAAAVAGVFIAFKVRERLMFKRYGK